MDECGYCKRSVISRLIGKIDSVDNRSCERQKDWKNVGFPTGVVVRGAITPGFRTLVTFTLLVLLKKNKNKMCNFCRYCVFRPASHAIC